MIWWCAEHQSNGGESYCDRRKANPADCRMVEALLIVKENAVKGQIWYTNQRRYEIDAEQPVMPGTYYIVPVDALASVGDSQ